MSAHHHILSAVQRICQEKHEWSFTPDEVVRALPSLNAQTVRTHVTSRCCVNARAHHQSRLAYFRRVGRGRYVVLPEHRVRPRPGTGRGPKAAAVLPQHDTIHAVLTKDGLVYVVSCHEVAVVTQGRTIDEALAHLEEALSLHLEGEDLIRLGLGALKRIQVVYELPADVSAA